MIESERVSRSKNILRSAQKGGDQMKTALMIILIISSIVLTASILFQSGNSAGLSGSIGGGAEQLFGKKKSRGYETILSRITTVCAVVFFIDTISIVAIS